MAAPLIRSGSPLKRPHAPRAIPALLDAPSPGAPGPRASPDPRPNPPGAGGALALFGAFLLLPQLSCAVAGVARDAPGLGLGRVPGVSVLRGMPGARPSARP